jgi:hypothetical protein
MPIICIGLFDRDVSMCHIHSDEEQPRQRPPLSAPDPCWPVAFTVHLQNQMPVEFATFQGSNHTVQDDGKTYHSLTDLQYDCVRTALDK